MELSHLFGDEALHLATMLAARAQAEGKNVMWDLVMSSEGPATGRVDEVRAHGYRTVGVFVDATFETSWQRMLTRYQEGLAQYADGRGYGGRVVPQAYYDTLRLPDGRSRPRQTFESLTPVFDDWLVFDNSGTAPRLVQRKQSPPGTTEAPQPGPAGERSGLVGGGADVSSRRMVSAVGGAGLGAVSGYGLGGVVGTPVGGPVAGPVRSVEVGTAVAAVAGGFDRSRPGDAFEFMWVWMVGRGSLAAGEWGAHRCAV